MFETGQFSFLWAEQAKKFNIEVDLVPGDWRTGADPKIVEKKLSEDKAHKIKAVFALHNETSTGVTSNIAKIRQAMDSAKHPALLMVDTISSLASIDYCHDDWKVDVTVGGSQKGLLLPPGLSFNAVSQKALEANKNPRCRNLIGIGSLYLQVIKMEPFLILHQLICFLVLMKQLIC